MRVVFTASEQVHAHEALRIEALQEVRETERYRCVRGPTCRFT